MAGFIPRKNWDLFIRRSSFRFCNIDISAIKLRRQKLMLIVLSGTFLIFNLFYFLAPNKKAFDSIPIGFETILIFVFIFFFLYEQLKRY